MIDNRSSGRLVFFQPPTTRQKSVRRRSTILAAAIALVAAGWIAGALLDPAGDPAPTRQGPFSYFPSQ